MLRNFILLVFAALVFWLAADLVLREQQGTSGRNGGLQPAQIPALEPIVPPPAGEQANRVADISVHTEEELEILLSRVEELLDRPRSPREEPLVAVVLHGPEVEFFALKNYDRYKRVVDHAAKLAALGAVEISICQTQMRNRGIGSDEVPSFLRQVPFGPDEVDRLVGEGYLSM